jgi:hypothetical protein
MEAAFVHESQKHFPLVGVQYEKVISCPLVHKGRNVNKHIA